MPEESQRRPAFAHDMKPEDAVSLRRNPTPDGQTLPTAASTPRLWGATERGQARGDPYVVVD